jgi:hypothetical protein
MSSAIHHSRVFETAGGFCEIAWNRVGITHFQLPASSAADTERNLRRRLSVVETGTPTAEVSKVIAAAQRYFAGAKVGFSYFRLDSERSKVLWPCLCCGTAHRLGQDNHLRLGSRGTRGRPGVCARHGRGHGQKPGPADYSLPPSFGG